MIFRFNERDRGRVLFALQLLDGIIFWQESKQKQFEAMYRRNELFIQLLLALGTYPLAPCRNLGRGAPGARL